MKKLITLIAVALFSTATFAQDNKMMDKKEPAKMASSKMAHDCYSMKDGGLIHCTGDKTAPQKTAVTLKDGSVVNTDGTIKSKDGKMSKLESGNCIDMMGVMGNCDKMHASMKPADKKAAMPK